MKTNKRVYYSKNEKILRVLCFIIIVVCEIIGILLFALKKPLMGALVIGSCAISSFLISSFFIGKIKGWFGSNPKKRVIYVAAYAIIILICLVTTSIASGKLDYDYDVLRENAIVFSENKIEEISPNSKIIETDVFEAFELNDSYYFAIEVVYTENGVGGATLRQYKFIYLKINMYTGTTEELDFKKYETAKTYLK